MTHAPFSLLLNHSSNQRKNTPYHGSAINFELGKETIEGKTKWQGKNKNNIVSACTSVQEPCLPFIFVSLFHLSIDSFTPQHEKQDRDDATAMMVMKIVTLE